MRVLSIFLLCISLTQLSGCDSKSNKPLDVESQNKYLSFIGSNLELPQTGMTLQNGKFVQVEIMRTNFTIVTRIDGTCTQCFVDFEKWKSLLDLAERRDDVSILFYVHTRDVDEFVSFYYPRLGISNPIHIDTLDQFLVANKISPNDNRNYHTFLLDEDGKVVLVGNPASHDSILKYYLKAIGI